MVYNVCNELHILKKEILGLRVLIVVENDEDGKVTDSQMMVIAETEEDGKQAINNLTRMLDFSLINFIKTLREKKKEKVIWKKIMFIY